MIVFVGTDTNVATEGKDRTTLAMPGNYNSLISQVTAIGNPRTAMVIQSDGPVDISGTQGDFPAIVFSGYNGESQGTALAQVLFGQVNPSGHLDFTWYKDDSQLPAIKNYGLTPSQTGGLGRTYMYFTGTPTYPFGYGLSYTHVQLLARQHRLTHGERQRHRAGQLPRHQHRHRPRGDGGPAVRRAPVHRARHRTAAKAARGRSSGPPCSPPGKPSTSP